MEKEQRGWQSYFAVGIGVLLFLLTLGLLLWQVNRKESAYEIVVLGDSLIGNANEGEGVCGILQERLGTSVFNGAFGGSTMSVHPQEETTSYLNDNWSMVSLAKAMAYDDWSVPRSGIGYGDYYQETNSQVIGYFKERILTLSKMDFNQVQWLLLEHGSNDYNRGTALDNPSDLYDSTTFGGALRSTLTLLKEKYPQLQIVLITPVYCEILGAKSTETSYGGGFLQEYVALEKEIAEEYGVTVIDAHFHAGIDENSAELDLADGLHLTQAGQEKLGNYIADCLEEIRE